MTITEDGDIIYVGKYCTHKLRELFADPDFEYSHFEISQQKGHYYLPVVHQGDAVGMFSQYMLSGRGNAIAYVEYGTDLDIGGPATGETAATQDPDWFVGEPEADETGAHSPTMEEVLDAL